MLLTAGPAHAAAAAGSRSGTDKASNSWSVVHGAVCVREPPRQAGGGGGGGRLHVLELLPGLTCWELHVLAGLATGARCLAQGRRTEEMMRPCALCLLHAISLVGQQGAGLGESC